MSDLLRLSATEAAAAIRAGELSPVALVEAVLDGIARTQRTLNAFVSVDEAGARAGARDAERAVAQGEELGPLHGVPYSVKDLTWTAGLRTTMGSILFEGFVPKQDAVPVARLRKAGAILVGKTTTPEFGHKPFTDSPLSGTSRNPWDLAHTPGGSSGGAAVAVAAGLGPVALGTDGGGSIRIPAACCGIVGLKPTLGRVPHIQAPDAFANNSFIGPLARTVADIRLILAAIEGPDPRDPYAVAVPSPPRPETARVAWTARVGNPHLDSEVEALAGEAARQIGAEPLAAPLDFVAEEEGFLVLLQASLAGRFGAQLERERGRMDPSLVETIERGMRRSAPEILEAAQARTALFRRMAVLFQEIDVLAMPTIAAPAPVTGLDPFAPFPVDGGIGEAGHIRAAWYPYTYPFNLTGHPALSVPAGRTASGLPVSLQLVGRWHEEGLLLDLAEALERARPWAADWPPHAA